MGKNLPEQFAHIPESSPKAGVLVSVPGTGPAKEALIANCHTADSHDNSQRGPLEGQVRWRSPVQEHRRHRPAVRGKHRDPCHPGR